MRSRYPRPPGDVVLGVGGWTVGGAKDEGGRRECMADSVTDGPAGWLIDKLTGRTRRVWVHSSMLLPAGIDAAPRSTKGLDE